MSKHYISPEDFRELLTDCERGLHNYEEIRTEAVTFKEREKSFR